VLGAWIALWHYADLSWWVLPSLPRQGVPTLWQEIAATVAAGGACAIYAAWRMSSRAPLPLREPRLAESLAYDARIAG
jgi:hypothetical protein